VRQRCTSHCRCYEQAAPAAFYGRRPTPARALALQKKPPPDARITKIREYEDRMQQMQQAAKVGWRIQPARFDPYKRVLPPQRP
jgi:hypothetical protein